MSKIKELKTNNDNIINLVDVLEMFSPDRKSKYTETLLRLMKGTRNINDHFEEIKLSLTGEFKFLTNEDLDKYSPIQLMIIHRFIDSFFNYSDLQSFRRFCEYNERNLIAQNDLTKYKSFDEILTQLSLADLKVETKNLENEIVKIHEDDEWLLLRPLTYLSSKKYGANTKWCTTSEGNSEYFERYSSKGVLIYCMNKKTGYKVASFYSLDKKDPEFSFWNQKDTRIDSLDTDFEEFEFVLVSIINQQTVARRVGLYSTRQSRITLDIVDPRWTVVPVEKIPVRTPVFEKTDAMFTVNDYLIRTGPTTRFNFNYQPLANQIRTKWQAVEYPENYYQAGGYNTGYYRDLRDAGFQTFGHVIDESFDQIDNDQDRLARIVTVVDDLCHNDLASFLSECYNVCKYNQQHLAELRTKVRKDFPDRFQQFINERFRF